MSKEVYIWQYNGAAPMRDIFDWCLENLTGDWGHFNSFEIIYFYNTESYAYFLLRWS